MNIYTKSGNSEFYLALGYKSEIIISRYTNIKDLEIQFSTGTVHDQTGRRVLNAYEYLEKRFLLVPRN